MSDNTFDPRHPHEPEIPPHFDADGRCLICVMICERDNAIRELNIEKKIAQKACLKIARLELALSEILKVNENTPVLIYQKMEDIAKAALKEGAK